ncbi:MAG TPA: epoxyqueuosine reductase QueH, partial [Clostridia bacterium]|nr:epoxyqueuosine reductase QueH [Clostridia bacterium]
MNEKVNYDARMLELIAGMQSLGRRPSLLLHACCAPCSSAVLERLAQDFDILLFFDNPNLDTLQEHDARAAETVRLLSMMLPCARVIVSPYEPAVFLEAVRGLEHLPEGGARCEACFRLRLSRS